MILTMDIGNTNIKIGLFQGETLLNYWRLATKSTYTSDELGILITGLFNNKRVNVKDITCIMLSSVVPSINFTVEHMCKEYFSLDPIYVNQSLKMGIEIKYENPRELGSDRICNAVGAYKCYGGPCIFIDFGTATTFGVVDEGGAFIGGCICPGIRLASEALVTGTAKLPNFELITPEKVIGKNTITNLQSGIIFGYVGQVNYLVQRMKKELNAENATVIATGGFSKLISAETDAIDIIDGTLTLKGLRSLYEDNCVTN